MLGGVFFKRRKAQLLLMLFPLLLWSFSCYVRAENGTCDLTTYAPKTSKFPLRFCNMFPDKACCLPAHDVEIQGYYEDMLESGDSCNRVITSSKNAIRQVFCMACDPLVGENYITYPNASTGSPGEIRICSQLANSIDLTTFDDCSMVRVEERGDDCGGDDTVIPSLYWGNVSNFLNDSSAGKPIYYEDFNVRVVSTNHPDGCYNSADRINGRGLPFFTFLYSLATVAVALVMQYRILI
mmetsp:Transcript_34058/g.53232  ORF Transcript_34058/g.53232 Transcript_34058/m.53232 type:complete len:239 (+) Transcript_34058:70-786(+)